MFVQSRGKSQWRAAYMLNRPARAESVLGCLVVWLTLISMPVAAQEKPVVEDRPLIDKARAGDLEAVRLEILSGANVNERGLEDERPGAAGVDGVRLVWFGLT